LRSYCEEQYPSDQSGERNQEFGKQLAARFETKS
jgi:hypothetical protein